MNQPIAACILGLNFEKQKNAFQVKLYKDKKMNVSHSSGSMQPRPKVDTPQGTPA